MVLVGTQYCVRACAHFSYFAILETHALRYWGHFCCLVLPDDGVFQFSPLFIASFVGEDLAVMMGTHTMTRRWYQ